MTRTLSLSGSYSRREDLVKATWDLDKGLLDAAGLNAIRLAAAREAVDLQTKAGVAAVTDGNLSWQDTFRGIVESTSGLEVGGVTRLFETNKFYRQPILKGRPVLNTEAFAKHFLLETIKVKGAKKAVLPSPYWFLRAAKIETPANAPEDALIADLVNGAARWLDGRGYSQIQFQEPLLFYEKAPDLDLARELLTKATKGIKAETIINFPNGDAAPHYMWATALPATWIGIDFVETLLNDVKKPKTKTNLVAAVVDSQESLLESPDEVRDVADDVQARLQPGRLNLTHTWDLEFLPAPVAAQKLAILSAASKTTVVA